jgi:hypothetical protein
MPDYIFTIQRRVTQQATVTLYDVANKTAAMRDFEKTYRLYPEFPAWENFDTNGWPEITRIEEVRSEPPVENPEVASGA